MMIDAKPPLRRRLRPALLALVAVALSALIPTVSTAAIDAECSARPRPSP